MTPTTRIFTYFLTEQWTMARNTRLGKNKIKQLKEELRSEMPDIKDLRKSNELLSKAKNLHHLQKLYETLRTITMDSRTYQEANLQAVFLLNRMENAQTEKKKEINQSKTSKYDYPSKSKKQKENIEDKSPDLKLRKQVEVSENESSNRIKKTKASSWFSNQDSENKQKEGSKRRKANLKNSNSPDDSHFFSL